MGRPPHRRRESGPDPQRTDHAILVYHVGALGDFVTFLPALRLLRRRRAHSRLILLTRPAWGELARSVGLADETIDATGQIATPLFTPNQAEASVSGLFGLFARISAPVREAFLVTTNPALINNCRAAGILHVHAHPPLPERDADVRMAPPANHHGTRTPGAQKRSAKGQAEPDAADAAADACNIETLVPRQPGPPAHPPEAIIHPGSGSALKSWPCAGFAQVATALHHGGYRVTWSFGPADHELSWSTEAVRPGDTVLRDLRPAELLRTLGEATLYLGVDSGVTHLAAAAGIPVFCLFGPTNDRVWRPAGPRVTVITDRTCCTRCDALTARAWDRPRCSRIVRGQTACLLNIPAARVVRTIRQAGLFLHPQPDDPSA